MSGRRSRDKGARTERAIARLLQAQGPGADICAPLLGTDLAVEVKCRSAGLAQLYDWLNERDILIVKADRREPLVVLRMSLAADIATPGHDGGKKAGTG